MSFNFSPKIVQNGMVLAFDAANIKSCFSGSTTWTDLKSGLTTTFKRKIAPGSAITIVPTFDSSNGGSIYFNGVSIFSGDGVYLPTGETLTNLSSQVTLSVWFKKPYNSSYVEAPASKGFNGGSYTQSYLIYTLNNGVYGRITTNTIGGYTDIGTTFTNDVWTNVSLTYNGTTMALYLNGVLKNSSAKSGPLMNGTIDFHIGCMVNMAAGVGAGPDKTSEFMVGNIANVLLYNRGLTSSEVLQNYNSLKPRFGL